jgi:hypothetical protein
LAQRVRYAKNSRKKYLIKETGATIASTREFGLKNRNFGSFFRARDPKNHFWIGVARAAA